MNASDIMVSDVITVKSSGTVEEVAGLLLKNRISALPVVDDAGKLVGMISEGDLIRRGDADTGHDRRGSRSRFDATIASVSMSKRRSSKAPRRRR